MLRPARFMDTEEDKRLIPHEPVFSTENFSSDDEIEFVDFQESESLDQPLYRAPVEVSSIVPKDLPSVTFSREFQRAILENPSLVRNVAIVGHLQHGKTSLIDMLVQSTHSCAQKLYTNTHYLEKKRGTTIFTKVMNLIAQNSRGKSYSINLIDTPGHVDFWDQLSVGIDLCDSILLVVDICEPLMPTDHRAIEQALARDKKVRVCINKLDKLVIDQQRNLESATARIFHVLEQLEKVVGVGFDLADVLFASTKFHWTFTLDTIVSLYGRYGNASLTVKDLATPSAFAKYALGPIFKLFYLVLSGDRDEIMKSLDSLGIEYQKKIFNMNVDHLLEFVFAKYFEAPESAIIDVLPPPPMAAHNDPLLNIVSLIPHGKKFFSLTKILDGKISSGQKFHSNGVEGVISDILIPQAQYNSATDAAFAGNIVLLSGIESLGRGFAVPINCHTPLNRPVATPLSPAIVKIGVAPYEPEKISVLQSNFELLKATWPGLKTIVEGTGEHLICGPGELFLDCALYALRNDFEALEIKVAEPVTQFRETVADESYLMCTTETPNGQGKFSFLAEPVPLTIGDSPRAQDLAQFGWDQLTIDSTVLSTSSCNFLVNEAFDRPNDKPLHEDIYRGFQEYLSSGPLCNEPVQCVAMKMSECELGAHQVTGQIAPIVRRACIAGHMVATPRLLEPIYKVVCIGPQTASGPLSKILSNRRGELTFKSPVPGSTVHIFKGLIPVLDSFGFETELRGYCHDQIQVNLMFECWSTVPGDPLDTSIKTRKLEKADRDSLARDILVKLRKRKGLSRDPDTSFLKE